MRFLLFVNITFSSGSCLRLEAYALLDRSKAHSLAHGHKLAQECFYREHYRTLAQKQCSHRKRVLQSSDLYFINVQAPPLCEQVVHMREVEIISDSGGQVGINQAPSDISKYLPTLLQKQLDDYGLAIVSAGDRGRCVTTRRARRDGDLICYLPSLFFDSEHAALKFLEDNEMNHSFVERIVRITGVADGPRVIDVFAVQLGVGRYLHHYAGIRREANATIVAQPSNGTSEKCLSLVCQTRNGGGIAAMQAQSKFCQCDIGTQT